MSRAQSVSTFFGRRRGWIVVACAALQLSAPARAAGADREALRKSLDQMLSLPPLSTSRCSLEVVSLEDGQTIYAHAPDEALNPASNTKLVTSAAALLRLGPEYRFTTDFLGDRSLNRGRVRTLYVKGRGDPSLNTERLQGLVADLWHRGLRSVGEIVLDDTHFDSERWGPGWEQETSDKSYAAPVGALSLNHNAVAIYVAPGRRPSARARVELEPETPDYFVLDNRVKTILEGGRRKLRPHTFADEDRTRVVVEGRIPLGAEPVVLYRRVTDPAFYFGQTLKMLLAQRGIRVRGRVKRGVVPESAALLASYGSQELAEIVREMNKASSNFIAETLVKTLGAELRGAPGTWPKGLEVTEEVLAELGLPRGTYQLRNGSGLNDTNRFSAHQMISLLTAVWKRFPVASEFLASLGIAARDGTLRLRMEGTGAAGRLRAKTGTLERVTALSGFVQSLGGERFAFSILVNDWAGRSNPVISAVDRLGGLIAAAGAPDAAARELALATQAPVELPPAELKARIAAYAALGLKGDKKNLPLLRTALRTERDPLLRIVVAEALYRSDPDQGGGALLEALPVAAEPFSRLRAVARELGLPVPAVPSLLDLAVDGNGEALARLFAIAPLARAAPPDAQLDALLAEGLTEVGDASAEEMIATLRVAPAAQAQAALELLATGLARARLDAAQFPLSSALRGLTGGDAAQAEGWLAILERGGEAAAPPAAAQVPPTAPPVASPSGAPAPAFSSIGADPLPERKLAPANTAGSATPRTPNATAPTPSTTAPTPNATAPTPSATVPGNKGSEGAAPPAESGPISPACALQPDTCGTRADDSPRPGGG